MGHTKPDIENPELHNPFLFGGHESNTKKRTLLKAAIDDETLSLRLYPSTPLSLFLLSHNAHGRCLTAHETV